MRALLAEGCKEFHASGSTVLPPRVRLLIGPADPVSGSCQWNSKRFGGIGLNPTTMIRLANRAFNQAGLRIQLWYCHKRN